MQLAAVDKTIDALDLSMLRLEDNIRDKESTLVLEEKVALLDGRVSVNQPPPSSIATVGALPPAHCLTYAARHSSVLDNMCPSHPMLMICLESTRCGELHRTA